MVKIVQHSFLGGQLDFEMMGRQDIERYSKGATKLLNFIPLKRGAIRKRPGMNLLHDVTSRIDPQGSGAAGKYRLVPFAYKRSEGWAILVTDGAMLAVGRGETVEVTKDGDIAFFTGDQVEEFDYCQSGDVMFLAHIDHPPCKLEHRVAAGENGEVVHEFRLSKFLANVQADDIPEISGATVSKEGITTRGAKVTEYYRVTAVFDGRETFPSATYSDPKCADFDSDYQTWRTDIQEAEKKGKMTTLDFWPTRKTYSGTTYTSPWTQSQKISLRLEVKPKVVDGQNVYPDQVRIYRKTGSLYGLVGFIDTKEIKSQVQVTSIIHTDEEAVDIDMVKDSVDEDNYGYGKEVYTLRNGTATFTMASVSKGISVTIYPGHLAIENDGDLDVGWVWSDGSSIRTPEYDTDKKIWYYGSSGILSQQAKACYVLNPDGSRLTEEGEDGSVIEVKPTEPIEGLTIEFTISDRQVYAWYGKTVGFTYTPACNNSSATVSVRHGSATEKTNIKISNLSNSLSFHPRAVSRYGEDVSDFIERAKKEVLDSLDQNTKVIKSVNVKPAEGDSDTFTIKTGRDLTIFGITVEGIGNDDSKMTFLWDDKYYTPDASQTPPRREYYMDKAGEYPACVCLSQQRLVWASTKNDPSRVIMSMIGDFESYAAHDIMVDDDPIDFKVSATKFPKVNHLVELKKLLLFNGAAEWVVDSASQASGVTYATIQARQHSSIGAASWLKPIICNNVVLFAEATGQAVRQYGYQLEDDGFGGDDISIFSSSIFRGRKIVSWAYQQHPHSTCWCVLSDGTLCSLTFMREHSTIAWATHSLGGDGKAKAIVCTEAITGNAGSLAETSQMFVLVERGGTWTVEEFRCDAAHGGDTVANALCLDSARVLKDGYTRRTGTVAIDTQSGREVNTAVPGAIEGYRFESEFTSVYPVVDEEVGLSQMDVKCVQEAHLRVADAAGGSIRAASLPDIEASSLRLEPQVEGGSAAFPDADVNVPLVTSNARDGRVTLKQDSWWPFTLLMLETDLECEENPGRRK